MRVRACCQRMCRCAGGQRARLGCACRLWELSWPLSGMEVLTFAKELIITAFVGRMGAFELSSLVLSQTLYNVGCEAQLPVCTPCARAQLRLLWTSRATHWHARTHARAPGCSPLQVFGNAPMLGVAVAMETFCGQVRDARVRARAAVPRAPMAPPHPPNLPPALPRHLGPRSTAWWGLCCSAP